VPTAKERVGNNAVMGRWGNRETLFFETPMGEGKDRKWGGSKNTSGGRSAKQRKKKSLLQKSRKQTFETSNE